MLREGENGGTLALESLIFYFSDCPGSHGLIFLGTRVDLQTDRTITVLGDWSDGSPEESSGLQVALM